MPANCLLRESRRWRDGARIDAIAHPRSFWLAGKAVGQRIHRMGLVGLNFELQFHGRRRSVPLVAEVECSELGTQCSEVTSEHSAKLPVLLKCKSKKFISNQSDVGRLLWKLHFLL
jgi:hypothetical protein